MYFGFSTGQFSLPRAHLHLKCKRKDLLEVAFFKSLIFSHGRLKKKCYWLYLHLTQRKRKTNKQKEEAVKQFH